MEANCSCMVGQGRKQYFLLCTTDVVRRYPYIPAHIEGLVAFQDVLLQGPMARRGNEKGYLVSCLCRVAFYTEAWRMAPSNMNIFTDRLERCLTSDAEIKPHTWW